MRPFGGILALALAAVSAASAASAGTLQVSPVTLQITAPGQATQLTVRNDSADPVNIQIRVYRWTQVDGEDRLERTSEIAISPPATSVAAGGENVVRIIRLSKEPVVGEENYRVLVDQLPEPSASRGITLNVLMRYSIPVFIVPRRQLPSSLSWSAIRGAESLKLTAHNTGERRIRITSLTVQPELGSGAIERNGLVGYVLAGGQKSWVLPVKGNDFSEGNTVSISGHGDDGEFHATTQISQD